MCDIIGHARQKEGKKESSSRTSMPKRGKKKGERGRGNRISKT